MKRLLYALLPAAMLLGHEQALAQRTGNYDTTVEFMNTDRAAALYVPAGYNPANKYRLIVALHGLGDTCSDYRDALVNVLGWGANLPNTIIICPEAANRSVDYYLPAGGEDIILESMHFVMDQYHIDTANVVLQGFSLGGRAALRYGLNNAARFKGLLLNTPAIQGVKEALNGPAYPFSYFNAPDIPIYITHGANDIAYTAPIDTMYEQLILNDAPVRLRRYTGMGHQPPPMAQMLEFIPFFDTPSHAGKDLELVRTYMPKRSCASTITPAVLIRNTGAETVTGGSVSIRVNGGTATSYSLTGILQPYQHAMIPLPPQSLGSGTNAISVEVTALNGGTDTVLANNKTSGNVEYVATAQALPFSEGFEGATFPPSGWHLEEAGEFYSAWAEDTYVKKNGGKSVNAVNTILFFDNAGRAEGLVSPVLNLSSVTNPYLHFDLAYNFHRFTLPYFTTDVDFADTLEVLVSTDCGDHYTSVFRKGGADLATFAEPIINPIDVNLLFAEPADSNWKRISIPLARYATSTRAVVKFNYISALGGSINIDEVSVASSTGVKPQARPTYTVSPNPATDAVSINPGTDAINRVVVLDAAGRTVLAQDRNAMDMQPFRMDLRSLAPGLYTLQLFTERDVHATKLAVRR